MPILTTTVVRATCREKDFTHAVTDTLATVAPLAAIHTHDYRPGHDINIVAATDGAQISVIKDSGI